MTAHFENQFFSGLTDMDTGRLIQGVNFRNCAFASSSISMGRDPALRSVLRNVRLENCRVRASFIGNPILDEVEVDGLETGVNFLLTAAAAVFRHVTLRGKIGRLQLNARAGSTHPASVQAAFAKANGIFYQNVDWALEISSAEFYSCDVNGVPYQLIRRDPSTQVVVTRERALRGVWKSLDLMGTFWAHHIEKMLESSSEGVVLAAPKGNRKNFSSFLDGLMLLREAGVAEAD